MLSIKIPLKNCLCLHNKTNKSLFRERLKTLLLALTLALQAIKERLMKSSLT